MQDHKPTQDWSGRRHFALVNEARVRRGELYLRRCPHGVLAQLGHWLTSIFSLGSPSLQHEQRSGYFSHYAYTPSDDMACSRCWCGRRCAQCAGAAAPAPSTCSLLGTPGSRAYGRASHALRSGYHGMWFVDGRATRSMSDRGGSINMQNVHARSHWTARAQPQLAQQSFVAYSCRAPSLC